MIVAIIGVLIIVFLFIATDILIERRTMKNLLDTNTKLYLQLRGNYLALVDSVAKQKCANCKFEKEGCPIFVSAEYPHLTGCEFCEPKENKNV